MNGEESEYTRLRLENIRRNQQFLNDIGISPLQQEISITNLKKSKRKHEIDESVPTRRSSRNVGKLKIGKFEKISYIIVGMIFNAQIFLKIIRNKLFQAK